MERGPGGGLEVVGAAGSGAAEETGAKRGAERPQVSDRSARRGGKSLAVELPQVEFAGALCAPEDGTKPSERSFSAVKRA